MIWGGLRRVVVMVVVVMMMMGIMMATMMMVVAVMVTMLNVCNNEGKGIACLLQLIALPPAASRVTSTSVLPYAAATHAASQPVSFCFETSALASSSCSTSALLPAKAAAINAVLP